MINTQQATQFTAPSGRSFVFTRGIDFVRNGEVLFSSDSRTFYALSIGGRSISTSSGKVDKMDVSFTNPHNGATGRLHYDGEDILCAGERYTRQEVDYDQSSVIPLPATRRTEYLCQAEESTVIYISADKHNFSYGSFKLFVGDGISMREIPIQHVERYRDGGTTFIRTSEATFFSPSPFSAQRDPNLVPQWNSLQWGSLKLTNLDKDDYNIVETASGRVTISKR